MFLSPLYMVFTVKHERWQRCCPAPAPLNSTSSTAGWSEMWERTGQEKTTRVLMESMAQFWSSGACGCISASCFQFLAVLSPILIVFWRFQLMSPKTIRSIRLPKRACCLGRWHTARWRRLLEQRDQRGWWESDGEDDEGCTMEQRQWVWWASHGFTTCWLWGYTLPNKSHPHRQRHNGRLL